MKSVSLAELTLQIETIIQLIYCIPDFLYTFVFIFERKIGNLGPITFHDIFLEVIIAHIYLIRYIR